MKKEKNKVSISEKVSVLSGYDFDLAYESDNYLIEERKEAGEICAIYFSSSGIYFPNTIEEFHKAFIDEDRYEWYETRLTCATKHIFVRDVAKQFYITGISKQIDTIDKLLDFLRVQTEGYRVITIGSSAGAYAATIAGIELCAEMIFSFSGYFNLNVLDKEVWPYIRMYANDKDRNKWYDIHDLVNHCHSEVIYFYPKNNDEDAIQSSFIEKNFNHIHIYPCESDIHGVPFGKKNLDMMFKLDIGELKKFFKKLDGELDKVQDQSLEQTLKYYKRLIIFGAGKDGQKCLRLLQEIVPTKRIVFWDNSIDKNVSFIMGVPVEKPSHVVDDNVLIIVASRKYGLNLQKQLEADHYCGDWIFMEELFCGICRMVGQLLEDRSLLKNKGMQS